ncbi:hypothetical protein [Salinicola sp. CR57]|uniref:hypothetical protein n=1 Tax=Salinicola sp. CR57 TaxID=1949086 RepID=UPI00130088AA|nr:hypothetical protein [Salinicola sp. CR57]
MRKPLTTVVVRRSRLSLTCQGLLALALSGYAGWWVDWRLAVLMSLTALALVARQFLSTPRRRYLRCMMAGETPVWECSVDARIWEPAPCRLVRLGPMLSAVDLSGRRLWLWPDSGDAHSLRCLRETLAGQAD